MPRRTCISLKGAEELKTFFSRFWTRAWLLGRPFVGSWPRPRGCRSKRPGSCPRERPHGTCGRVSRAAARARARLARAAVAGVVAALASRVARPLGLLGAGPDALALLGAVAGGGHCGRRRGRLAVLSRFDDIGAGLRARLWQCKGGQGEAAVSSPLPDSRFPRRALT